MLIFYMFFMCNIYMLQVRYKITSLIMDYSTWQSGIERGSTRKPNMAIKQLPIKIYDDAIKMIEPHTLSIIL